MTDSLEQRIEQLAQDVAAKQSKAQTEVDKATFDELVAMAQDDSNPTRARLATARLYEEAGR